MNNDNLPPKRKQHRWDFTPKSKKLDAGVSGCKYCECIREFVGGKVHYFINDQCYHTAPPCDPNFNQKT